MLILYSIGNTCIIPFGIAIHQHILMKVLIMWLQWPHAVARAHCFNIIYVHLITMTALFLLRLICNICWWINSSPHSTTYMRQWIESALVQIMACRLLTPSHYLNQRWVIVNWILTNKLQWNFNQKKIAKIHLKISSVKWRPFCPRGDELRVTAIPVTVPSLNDF